jgi:hypothetical protein
MTTINLREFAHIHPRRKRAEMIAKAERQAILATKRSEVAKKAAATRAANKAEKITIYDNDEKLQLNRHNYL